MCIAGDGISYIYSAVVHPKWCGVTSWCYLGVQGVTTRRNKQCMTSNILPKSNARLETKVKMVGSEEEFGPWLTNFYPRFALMGDSLPRLCTPSTVR